MGSDGWSRRAAERDPIGIWCDRCGAEPMESCRVVRDGKVAYYYGTNDFHAARQRGAFAPSPRPGGDGE